MKNPTAKEFNALSFPKETEEWINRTLKRIHRKMVELFGVDFAYFSDIKIIKQSDILKQLIQRIQDDLKENGLAYNDTHWKHFYENLSKNRVLGFFENFAFYNPKDEVLYMNEKMITSYPEKIVPTCTHELSEKLLSTYLASPLKTPAGNLVEAYFKAKKTGNSRKLGELWSTYINIIFKTAFKEGFCEAIALQTLRHIDSEIKVASLEKELQIGYSKCADLLFYLDGAKKKLEDVEKNQPPVEEKRQRTQPLNEKKGVKEILIISQVIKGLSYYLGYPIAKAVMEKYGIEGAKLALEKYPPLKAQYFADPQTYLTQLEKLRTFNK